MTKVTKCLDLNMSRYIRVAFKCEKIRRNLLAWRCDPLEFGNDGTA